jgi:putative transposase
MTYKCGAGFRIHGKRLHLAKIGHIKAVFWRGLAGVAIKTVTVKREADGWYAVLSCDVPLPPALPSTGRAVGVDLGLKSLVATSTGATVEPSWALAEADTKLVRLQRVIARRQNSSARRRTAARALAVAHQRVSRQRKAHLDNVVAALIRENDLVVVEDLNVAGLARSRLTKSVHNASWGYLLSKLDSKAEEAGRRVVRVDPRGTSQTCPGCGKIEPKPLAQREHRCVCGLELDRDVAAAQVILDRGLRLLRGEEGQQASSVKREVRPGLTA